MPNTTLVKTKISARTKVLIGIGVLFLLGLGAYGLGFTPAFIRIRVAAVRGIISISLLDFFQNPPQGQTFDFDPLTGPVRLYWLDDDGNICSGDPGESGQPGSVEFSPSNWADAMGRRDESISAEELASYQRFNISINDFTGTGTHFLQFVTNLFRSRDNGNVFQSPSGLILSLPQDISLQNRTANPASFRPQYIFSERHPCFAQDNENLMLPSASLTLEGQPAQHSSKCQRRQNVTATALVQACAEGRLEGSFSEGFLRIRPAPATLSFALAPDAPAGRVATSTEQIIAKFTASNPASAGFNAALKQINYSIDSIAPVGQIKIYAASVSRENLLYAGPLLLRSRASAPQIMPQRLPNVRQQIEPIIPSMPIELNLQIPAGISIPLIFMTDTSNFRSGNTLSVKLEGARWNNGVNPQDISSTLNLSNPLLTY